MPTTNPTRRQFVQACLAAGAVAGLPAAPGPKVPGPAAISLADVTIAELTLKPYNPTVFRLAAMILGPDGITRPSDKLSRVVTAEEIFFGGDRNKAAITAALADIEAVPMQLIALVPLCDEPAMAVAFTEDGKMQVDPDQFKLRMALEPYEFMAAVQPKFVRACD